MIFYIQYDPSICNIRSSIFDVRYMMLYMMFDIRLSVDGVWCVMLDHLWARARLPQRQSGRLYQPTQVNYYMVFDMIYDVRYSIFDILCSIFDIWYTMLDIRYLIYNVRYSIPGLWQYIFHIRYLIFNIWYSIFDIRYFAKTHLSSSVPIGLHNRQIKMKDSRPSPSAEH